MFAFKTIVWGSIFMLAALVLGPWVTSKFDSAFPVFDLGVAKYFGVVLIAAGIALSFCCCAVLFLPQKGNLPKPYDMQHEFVVLGPYAYVRNPFLLGILLALAGETIMMSSFAMIAYSVVLAWCVHFFCRVF